MPRYHLNIFNGSGPVPDEPGQQLDTVEAAREQAVVGIRSILSAEVLEGTMDLRGRIEICDPEGRVLLIVPYADAVTLQLPESS